MGSWAQYRPQYIGLRLIPVSVGSLMNALLVQFVGTLPDRGAVTADQIFQTTVESFPGGHCPGTRRVDQTHGPLG
jgi:hypothetical protein